MVTHVFGNKKNKIKKNNINIAIVNGNECGVSCLKYKIILWRQFCIIVDSNKLRMWCVS